MKPKNRSNTPLRDLRTFGASRAPRLAGCDYASDEIVHLTICAHHGAPFSNAGVAEMICEDVEFYSSKLGFRMFGYWLMPDHLHVLLSPDDSGNSVSHWLQASRAIPAIR